MEKLNTVIELTKNPKKYLKGKSLNAAIRYNGKAFVTSHNITGIPCGYRKNKDYWVYWVETRMLVHYDGLNIDRLFVEEKTTQLSSENIGVESIEVPGEMQALFLELSTVRLPSIVKAYGPAALGHEQCREIAKQAKKPLEEKSPVMHEYILLRKAIEDLGFEIKTFETNGKKHISLIPA